MIDLHSHLLPGLDDGPKDMETSLEMAKLYVKNGIHRLIATPHHIKGIIENSPDLIRETVESLNNELVKHNIPLKVYPGNEIYVTEDIVGTITDGKVLTLNDSKYVLIEFPPRDRIPDYVKKIIYELKVKGLVPIIAHAERYLDIIDDPNILYNFINLGALAQLNLPSLAGSYGEDIRRSAMKLLEHEMIHLVGSDAHSPLKRTPNVMKSYEILEDLLDDEVFERITKINPKHVLENKEVEIKDPKKVNNNGHNVIGG